MAGQEERWAPRGVLGRCCAVGCPTRHGGMQPSPLSLVAGDAAHRPAGPRILRFALGHAVRMLLEPAASSRDERSQPVPSRGTRPAAEPPGPCSAAGRRRGGKTGRKNLVFGRLRSPPSRAVLCVCASLFSSFWLMKYHGSLRCSSVSAFRFGFIDLSWGLGWGVGCGVWGGQFHLVWQSAFPSRGTDRRDRGGTPATGKLSPAPAPLLCRIFLFPVAFLAERPRSRVEVGPGLPVSLHVLTKTPGPVPCPHETFLWGANSGAKVGGSPIPGCSGCRQALGPAPSTRTVLSLGSPQPGAGTRATAIRRRALARLLGD